MPRNLNRWKNFLFRERRTSGNSLLRNSECKTNRRAGIPCAEWKTSISSCRIGCRGELNVSFAYKAKYNVFAPQEVEKRIPNMYKKLPYDELLERQNLVKSGALKLEQTTEQKEQTQEEMKQELDKVNQDQIENPPIERKEKVTEQLLVEGFGEEQNTLMAKIEYRGEKLGRSSVEGRRQSLYLYRNGI